MISDDSGPDPDRYLNSTQLNSVDNLRIVMTLFWLLKPLGDLLDTRDDCAPLQILQGVLHKLREVKAREDGPLLECLTLEALSAWRPGGRTGIKKEEERLYNHRQVAIDAGVRTLRVGLFSGWNVTNYG